MFPVLWLPSWSAAFISCLNTTVHLVHRHFYAERCDLKKIFFPHSTLLYHTSVMFGSLLSRKVSGIREDDYWSNVTNPNLSIIVKVL